MSGLLKAACWKDWLSKASQDLSGINLPLAAVFIVFGVVLAAISPSQAVGYVIAATVALIVAFVAYPWQKNKDRDLKIEEEKRKVVGELIQALETHFSALSGAGAVAVDKVPSFSAEIVNLRTGSALVQAYDCKNVLNDLIAYEASAKNYIRKLTKEKELRSGCQPHKSRPDCVQRTSEYTNAQKQRSEAWLGLKNNREKLFETLGNELGVKLIAQKIENEADNQQDEEQ